MVLSLLLVPVLLGLSMLAQRPVSRWLGVKGAVWPLRPLAPGVKLTHRLAIRGSGALFVFGVVLAVFFLQARREQHLSTRVEVAEGMAAARAGMQSGDVITAVGGEPVSSFAEVRDALLRGPPRQTIGFLRGARVMEVTLVMPDGLLGVKASGEGRAATNSEAMGTALRRLFSKPSTGGLAQLASLWVTLGFSFWLMISLELAALVVSALSPAGRGRK